MASLTDHIRNWTGRGAPRGHMSANLVRYLDECWDAYETFAAPTRRHGMIGRGGGLTRAYDPTLHNRFYNMVYKIYNAEPDQRPPTDYIVKHFFEDLAALGRPILAQTGEMIPRMFLNISCGGAYRGPLHVMLDTKHVDTLKLRFQRGHVDTPAKEGLQRAFFHFGMGEVREISKRIYLNVRNPYLGSVMKVVNREIIPLPGIASAKFSPPSEKSRRDSALIYCQDDGAREDALDVLRDYQAASPMNRMSFGTNLPHMVKADDDMRGVGMADEPPRHLADVLEGEEEMFPNAPARTSFGTYRAHLIAFALTHTHQAGQSKAFFFARTGAYFQFAKVNIMHPDLYVDRTSLDSALSFLRDVPINIFDDGDVSV